MPLRSDLVIDATRFDPTKISERTRALNAQLVQLSSKGPKWWEVGAPKYREMRANGETAFPTPLLLPTAQTRTIPSRDANRQIPIRIFTPPSGQAPTSIFLHIHGGGWVLQTEASQDTLLQNVYAAAGCTVVSVGYRLAPEHPYPAANEDCEDVAEWLSKHGKEEFGAEVGFIGGESAGAHLALVTAGRVLEKNAQKAEGEKEVQLKGLVLSFGIFDASAMLPQAWTFQPEGGTSLILDGDTMAKFIEAYFPGKTLEQRRDPWISPIFMDWRKFKKLPPALFVCGTMDPLLDDSVVMSTKWATQGGESILKIYPGAPHAFTGFPPGASETVEDSHKDITAFINERL